MESSDKLEQQIETLIRAHLAACHAAVAATVERVFAAAKSEPARRPRPVRARSVPTRRRTHEELAALGERLYAAICASPGERMSFLAAQLGTTAQRLEVPVAQLKRAGRVRSVGERVHTRYFPLVGEAKDGKAVNA
jgi:hypothetical protein